MKPSLESIRDLVSRYLEIPVNEIVSKSREAHRVYARQLCYLLMRKYNGESLKNIGYFMRSGNKRFEHTTIIHGIRTIRNRMEVKEPQVIRDVANLENMIKGLSKELMELSTTNECIESVVKIMERLPDYEIKPCKTFGELADYLQSRKKAS